MKSLPTNGFRQVITSVITSFVTFYPASLNPAAAKW